MQSKIKFTEDNLPKLAIPPAVDALNRNGKPVKDLIYWDEEVPGFGVRVGRPRDDKKPRRTFILQKDIRGQTRRVTIGRWPSWTIKQARKRAHELIVQMDTGIDPNAAKREKAARGVTLAEAIAFHQTAMRAKRCSPTSIETIREECDRHVADWLARPIASLTKNECAQRHESITERSGPYSANRVLQVVRAVFNTAARRMDDMPPNPTIGVTFNKVRRRREPIQWAELPTWFARVEAINNPIRRDLQLLLLFTGLRSTDAKTIRWEHVNFEARTLHRPKPKGGEDRAFTVPVSAFVLEILRRRREENHLIYPDDKGWVFPSTDMRGRVAPVAQAKEQRYDGRGHKVEHLPSPHRLRDTFASAAHEARLHPMDLKVLLNHSLPGGDVTEGYIRPSIEHLRGCAERVAEFLLARSRQAVEKTA
jgi:integrase